MTTIHDGSSIRRRQPADERRIGVTSSDRCWTQATPSPVGATLTCRNGATDRRVRNGRRSARCGSGPTPSHRAAPPADPPNASPLTTTPRAAVAATPKGGSWVVGGALLRRARFPHPSAASRPMRPPLAAAVRDRPKPGSRPTPGRWGQRSGCLGPWTRTRSTDASEASTPMPAASGCGSPRCVVCHPRWARLAVSREASCHRQLAGGLNCHPQRGSGV